MPSPDQAPIYDFKTSRRVGYRTVQQPSSRVVIVEGIYALSQQIRRAWHACHVRSHGWTCTLFACNQRCAPLYTGSPECLVHSANSAFTGCRPLLDLRVSVTGGVHLDLVKRVLRDIKRSGQAPDEIIQQARSLMCNGCTCRPHTAKQHACGALSSSWPEP